MKGNRVTVARKVVPGVAAAIRTAGNFRRVLVEVPVNGKTVRGDTDLQKAAKDRVVRGASCLEQARPTILQQLESMFINLSRTCPPQARVKLTDTLGHNYILNARIDASTHSLVLQPA